MEAMFDDDDDDLEPIAMKASVDPDTMYLHEAMKQPDRKHFLKAMDKEATNQHQNGNCDIVKRDTIPKGTKVLPLSLIHI